LQVGHSQSAQAQLAQASEQCEHEQVLWLQVGHSQSEHEQVAQESEQ